VCLFKLPASKFFASLSGCAGVSSIVALHFGRAYSLPLCGTVKKRMPGRRRQLNLMVFRRRARCPPSYGSGLVTAAMDFFFGYPDTMCDLLLSRPGKEVDQEMNVWARFSDRHVRLELNLVSADPY
jgi:hypothetical protein